MNEDRKELLDLHRQIAMHEERFHRLVTKDEMAIAIAAAIDRQTMTLEKLEVDMNKRFEELVNHKRQGGGDDKAVKWVSLGLTGLIVLLGLLGSTDSASLALDVGSFTQ